MIAQNDPRNVSVSRRGVLSEQPSLIYHLGFLWRAHRKCRVCLQSTPLRLRGALQVHNLQTLMYPGVWGTVLCQLFQNEVSYFQFGECSKGFKPRKVLYGKIGEGMRGVVHTVVVSCATPQFLVLGTAPCFLVMHIPDMPYCYCLYTLSGGRTNNFGLNKSFRKI